MTDPLVSVILPAYNREAYIAGAIESVLNQTVSNWELIVVDDGSTDGTLDSVRPYTVRHPGKVKVISQRNSGVAVARNTGIRHSRGTHVAFIDSDDTWHPRKLERQIAVSRRNPHLAFLYTGYQIVDSSGRPQRTVRPDRRFQGDISRLLWTEENEILGPTLLVSRDKLFAVGLYDEHLRGAENLDLRLKLARLGPVAFIDDTLYYYRKHAESLTADQETMLACTRAMIESHFEGARTPADLRLRSQVRAACAYREGSLYFERMEYGKAIRSYARSWWGSRRKRELLIRTVRCLVGRRGNSVLRALKANWKGAGAEAWQ